MLTNKTNIIDFSNTYLECPICLEVINDTDPTLILECCKNKVHLLCLEDWYSKHAKGPICILCNQYNSFCAEYIIPIDNDISHNPLIVPIHNHNISSTSTLTIDTRIKLVIFITVIVILGLIVPLVITLL